jgi:hypothetical protein
VGATVGFSGGDTVGAGCSVGTSVAIGIAVGFGTGVTLGTFVGTLLGFGSMVGSLVAVGFGTGVATGSFVGTLVGLGMTVGATVGRCRRLRCFWCATASSAVVARSAIATPTATAFGVIKRSRAGGIAVALVADEFADLRMRHIPYLNLSSLGTA